MTRPCPAAILVVDDDSDLRRATCLVLRRAGFEALEAASGSAGLAAARDRRPAVVLLDVILPDLEGFEVCRLLKADPRLADTFVVLVSGQRRGSDEQAQGLDAGADGYILRPLGNRELRARVELMLRLRDARVRLRREHEGLEEAQRLAGIGSFELDLRTGEVSWSRHLFTIFARDPGGPAPSFEAFPGLFLQEDAARARRAFSDLIERGVPLDLELRVVTPGASIRTVHILGEVRRREDGGVSTVHGTILDITARRQAEQQLREAVSALRGSEDALRRLAADLELRVAQRTAELSRASRAKGDFLASMNHELRTPLNGILGLSEAFEDGVYGELDAKQREAIGRIRGCGMHLLSLVNDILDFAKIEAGELALELQPVVVADLCRSVVSAVEEQAGRKRIAVALSEAPRQLVILADGARLKQALRNLLTNAVKFTPEGGRVGLEATVDASTLSLAVWDTGIGIAEEDLPRLFQPFIQLDARLSRRYAGTGLGLLLVRRIVELHGGTVAVESVVGEGTRVTIGVPARRCAASDGNG